MSVSAYDHDHGYLPSSAAASSAPRPANNGMAGGVVRAQPAYMPVTQPISQPVQSHHPQHHYTQPVSQQSNYMQPVQMGYAGGMYGGGQQYGYAHSMPYGSQQASSNSLMLNVPVREPTPPPPVVQQVKVEAPPPAAAEQAPEEEDGEIDIQIRNVVCNYTLPLHIDLRKLALHCNNVTFDRGRGVLLKQKRNPNCYVKIYSSGKVYIVGCRSEADCRIAARSIARSVQKVMDKLNAEVRIRNYRVCNVLATCKMPFGIKIEEVAQKYTDAQYEPELSVGLVWRMTDPKATLRIHTTGSVTVTGAQSEEDVMRSIEIIYPIVREFRCAMRSREPKKRKRAAPRAPPAKRACPGPSRQSGVVGNQVYFSDEDEDIYGEDMLDDDEI